MAQATPSVLIYPDLSGFALQMGGPQKREGAKNRTKTNRHPAPVTVAKQGIPYRSSPE